MKLQKDTLLTPAQKRAMEGIIGGLPAGDVFVLRSAPGMGRTTVLQRVHDLAGGALLGVREFMRSLAAREPAAIEEAFLDMVEQALAAHQLVIVDDLHLVANTANNYKYPRAHLLDAALTGIMGEAAAWRQKLVFGVEDEAPWPVRRRAYAWEIAAFGVEDFECICRSLLPAEVADRLDYAQIHRFAPALSAQRLKNACNWMARERGTETAGFIEYLRSHDVASNVEIGVDGNDLKGVDEVIRELEAKIALPFENGPLSAELRLKPKRGVLLAGPPGTGKTTIGRALAHRLRSKFFLIDGTMVAGSGDFYEDVGKVFESAKRNAPSVVFIDDADVIFEGPRRHTSVTSRQVLRRSAIIGAVRTYFHVDMDAFFVSVEELYDPSLKGKPVVVGGRPNERGVVSAASYAARKFGVHSAMPLRTAYKLCPQAIFVEGHPTRYREYSGKVYEVLQAFSPLVEMASVDEAYLDVTGSERLYGPPLKAAHLLHQRMKAATNLNCSIGIAASRLVAKISSDQAKPNGVLWVIPGRESAFLAPLDVRKVPGVGKVTEKNLHAFGIRKVGDLARLDDAFLEEKFGKWGLALAGKSRGLDAGGWYDTEIGEDTGPKSISHEHTFSEDTADRAQLESTLAKLSEMVGRRLREHSLLARTLQLKLRYSDFSTITRAHSIPRGTQLDTEIYREIRGLFDANWKPAAPVRLLGIHASSWADGEEQMDLLAEDRHERWRKTLAVADRMRDKYGDAAVGLAAGMRGAFRERTHENPAGLPGKKK